MFLILAALLLSISTIEVRVMVEKYVSYLTVLYQLDVFMCSSILSLTEKSVYI